MKQKEISEIQVQLPVTKQIEGHSVVRGRSMFGDGGTMFFSRVSFILIPVIKRIFFVKTIHIIISVGFSQYRSGGYREVFSVSFYHGSMRNVRIFIETVSVDQQMLRTDQRADRQPGASPERRRGECLSRLSLRATPLLPPSSTSFSITSRSA